MKQEERDKIVEKLRVRCYIDNETVMLADIEAVLNSFVSEEESVCEHDYGSVRHLVWMCKKCDRVWMGEKKPL